MHTLLIIFITINTENIPVWGCYFFLYNYMCLPTHQSVHIRVCKETTKKLNIHNKQTKYTQHNALLQINEPLHTIQTAPKLQQQNNHLT